MKKGAQAFFLHYYVMEWTTDERQTIEPHKLEYLLGGHSDIFQNHPHGLSPPCYRDHIVELILRSAPIKKSYRKSLRNKSKIERLVQELLDTGIFTRSNSPFFSPFILIRKKDRSYILYIDYQALNKVTIKRQFSHSLCWRIARWATWCKLFF